MGFKIFQTFCGDFIFYNSHSLSAEWINLATNFSHGKSGLLVNCSTMGNNCTMFWIKIELVYAGRNAFTPPTPPKKGHLSYNKKEIHAHP